MSVYYKKYINIDDNIIDYAHNQMANVSINGNTVSMNKELFIKMCSIVNKIYNIKVNSDNQYENIIDDVINWMIDNYNSKYTALVKIKNTEYICIKSVKYLQCILNELGYGLCTAEFLREIDDSMLLRDKGKYSRHGKNLPEQLKKFLNINSRVVIFTNTVNYINEYKKLCDNNEKYLYGLEDANK